LAHHSETLRHRINPEEFSAMSSCSHSKRVWEAPVATILSVRSTAALTGGGSDNFSRYDIIHRPGLSPAAPLVDVGALPVASRTESAKAPETDQRSWQAPVVTTLTI
jgi:hypothetical protein